MEDPEPRGKHTWKCSMMDSFYCRKDWWNKDGSSGDSSFEERAGGI